MNPLAQLEILAEEGIAILLHPGTYEVGRHAASDIRFRHRSVSRRHARLVLDVGLAMVSDRTSQNGTFVEGKRIAKCELEPGAVLRFGEVVCRFDWLVSANFSEESTMNDTQQAPLSPAEQRVHALLLGTDSEEQIANRLCLSKHTVHNHTKAIYRKLGVHSRIELVRLHKAK